MEELIRANFLLQGGTFAAGRALCDSTNQFDRDSDSMPTAAKSVVVRCNLRGGRKVQGLMRREKFCEEVSGKSDAYACFPIFLSGSGRADSSV